MAPTISNYLKDISYKLQPTKTRTLAYRLFIGIGSFTHSTLANIPAALMTQSHSLLLTNHTHIRQYSQKGIPQAYDATLWSQYGSNARVDQAAWHRASHQWLQSTCFSTSVGVMGASGIRSGGSGGYAMPTRLMRKEDLVERLLDIKHESGLSFEQISKELGITNAYAAQLFLNQAQLKPSTAVKLKALLPAITADDIKAMQAAPMRSFDEDVIQEPLVYRLYEAVMHYGEGLKMVVNEKFGDGIMSAIDFYVKVDKVKGNAQEDRIVITFNGKFLPHVEQLVENDTSGNSTTSQNVD